MKNKKSEIEGLPRGNSKNRTDTDKMKFKRKLKQYYYKGKNTVRRIYSERDKTYLPSNKKVWKKKQKSK